MKMGMQIAEPMRHCVKFCREQDFRSEVKRMTRENPVTFLYVILPMRFTTAAYTDAKNCEIEFGITTQCIKLGKQIGIELECPIELLLTLLHI